MNNKEIRLIGNDAREIIEDIKRDIDVIKNKVSTLKQEDVDFMKRCIATRERLLAKKLLDAENGKTKTYEIDKTEDLWKLVDEMEEK